MPDRILPLTLATVLLSLAGCSLASEPIPAGPIQTGPLPGESLVEDLPAALPRAAEGSLIFQERCAACHGLEGAGDGEFAAELATQGAEPPDLRDPVLAQSRSPQTWYLIITNGTIQQGGLMPPWSDTLTTSQRWDVAYFVYTLSADADAVGEGAALFEANCAACHGPDAEPGPLDDFAALATLSQSRLIETFIANPEDADHQFDDLAEDERASLAAYVQTLGYDAELPAASAAAGDEPVAPADLPDLSAAPDGEAAPTGVSGPVSGQVINATVGGTLPADLTVGLRGVTLDETGSIVEFLSRTTPLDEAGQYQFEDVPFDREQSAYVVNVVRDGVEFLNGALLEPGTQFLNLPVTIYEVTSDPSTVVVDSMHVIVRALPDSVLVAELLLYSNLSDRVYATEDFVTGGRRGGVALQLPQGAEAIAFDRQQIGVSIIPMDDRFQRTASLPPGERSEEILVTYLLEMGTGRDLVLPITYQTRSVNLLVDEALRVRTEDFTPSGTQTVEGHAFDQYVIQDVAADSTLSARLRPKGIARESLALVIGMALIGATVGYGIYAFFLRPAPIPAASGRFSPDQQALLRHIADLDEHFEAGEVNRLDYEAQRAELKARVAEGLE